MPVTCNICNKVYSTQFNLNKHCRTVHNIKTRVYSYAENVFNFKCSVCLYSFPKSLGLIEHMRSEHGEIIQEEKMEFDTLEEFRSWKYRVEQKELCNYVVTSGEKGGVQYFICNRSGNQRTGKKDAEDIINRKRNTKTQGSAKLNLNCISKITLRKKETKLIASRIINHCAHSAEVQHLRIGHLDRQELASKLVNGVSTRKVLDGVREKISTDLKRMDLLTRQDVNNIKRSYNIHINEGVKHKNDSTSIELWVEECKSLELNPVLLYKPQGQPLENFGNSDFCLIIMNDVQQSLLKQFGSNIIAIDSTHGLNNYDFELTTLMIVDEFNEGFPVAFMFSNKKDTFINHIFFNTIKHRVGVINCKTFMSDITGTFYNAWVQIMGASSHQLFCSWHVDRAWRTNLNKISNKDKKTFVYKTLKYLQKTTEFVNADAFQEQLKVAIDNMLDDSDTKLFGEYFLKYYSENFSKWAYFFRKNCGINTNMRLESMHKVIKYFYLEGKSVKRLDKGLHATLKYVRDKIVDRLIKHTKGKRNRNSQDNFKTHRLALSSSFDISKRSPGVWDVTNNNSKYCIQSTDILNKCCNFICQFCDICVHQYTCTCPNYFINSIICKHIHFVVLNNNTCTKVTSTCSSFLPLNEEESNTNKKEEDSAINDCLDFFTKSNTQNVNSCDRKEKILKEMSDLQMLIHNQNFTQMTDSIFQQLIMNLHTAKNLLKLPTQTHPLECFKDVTDVSTHKIITPQKRFFSTQEKKKITKEKIKNPNKDESEEISNVLKGINVPFKSNDSSFDHSYI